MEAQFLKKHAKASQRKRYETDYKPKQTQQAHTVHIDEKPDELPTVEVIRGTVEQQKHFRPSRSRHSQLKELTRIKDFDSFPLADFAPNPTLHPRSSNSRFIKYHRNARMNFSVKTKYSKHLPTKPMS